MTPKEDAIELVDMFIPFQSDDYPNSDENYNAKKCALICVKEMLKKDLKLFDIERLKEVKQEIEKL
tara:strand:+ start:98 stop:295 length:198 start_codon:yes stop_codon:yes gene_type:complete